MNFKLELSPQNVHNKPLLTHSSLKCTKQMADENMTQPPLSLHISNSRTKPAGLNF